MFISEELAQERIRSSANILNRVRRDDGPVDTSDLPLPPAPLGEVTEEGAVDSEEQKAESFDASNPTDLKKLLAGDQERTLGRRRSRTLEEQASIGLTAAVLSTYAAERMHGISHMQANNYEHGFTNTQDRMNPAKEAKQALLSKILEKNDVVVDKCFERLLLALDTLDETAILKLAAKPEKLSRVASDLHRIISSSTPKEADERGGNAVHFHVWRPEVKSEEHYEVINVGGGAQ